MVLVSAGVLAALAPRKPSPPTGSMCAHRRRLDAPAVADSLHSDLRIDPGHMRPFLDFAREAVVGRESMLITHSEVFADAFASTTQTADYLLE